MNADTGDTRFPFEDPTASLAPTAAKLVATARRILAEDGFSALTVKAITTTARENIASVHYYFGNKEGLIRALLDSHTYDSSVSLLREARALYPGIERTDIWLEGMRRISEDRESFAAFFELLPRALRDPALRERLGALYDWYRESNVEVLAPEIGHTQARALSILIVAAVDGLAIQHALDPSIDTRYATELLKGMVRTLGAESDASATD